MYLSSLLALIPLSYAAVVDCRRRIIPNAAVALIALCALSGVAMSERSVRGILMGGIGMGAFLLLATSVARCELGGGDFKLCVALGMLFGFGTALSMLAGALVLMLVYGKLKRVETAPFAPFLLFSVIVYLFFHFLKGV